jgi:citrate synthase
VKWFQFGDFLMTNAKLSLDGKDFEFPITVGSEKEVGIDFTSLRAKTGAVGFDPGYGNTGSCKSAITFIDGDAGILRYRGYPIEQLAASASFVEVCYLLIYGHLPSQDELSKFQHELTYHTLIPEDMKKFFEGYTSSAHPMAILASMVISLSAYYPDNPEMTDLNIVRLLAKAKTLAGFSYKKSIGQPYVYPRNDLSYTADFLHMLFAVPSETYKVPDVVDRALNMLLILHADHEQNCSTSTGCSPPSGRASARCGGRCTVGRTRKSSKCWK